MTRLRWHAALVLTTLVATTFIASVVAVKTSSVPAAASGITLIVDFGNGTVVSSSGLNGSTVLEITELAHSVDVDWYGSLALVTAIDGTSSIDGGYWQYWVNGEYASIACNLYELSDDDAVRWVRTNSAYTGPEASLSNNRLFGIIFVAGFGVGTLLLLSIMVRRKR